jgi:hypothetical protein
MKRCGYQGRRQKIGHSVPNLPDHYPLSRAEYPYRMQGRRCDHTSHEGLILPPFRAGRAPSPILLLQVTPRTHLIRRKP